MDREEAEDALQMLRKLASKTRDDTALQNWGLIWMCSAVTNSAGFFGTHLLMSRGSFAPLPYVGLWAVVFVFNGAFILLLKGKAEGAPSFIDRTTFAIWNTFILGMAMTALVNYLMGIQVMLFMPAVASVLAAMTFAIMGSIMGRAWYGPAAVWALMAVVLALRPREQFAIFAAMWLVTQGTGGALLHRAKLRLRRAA
ncbi:MAG: hypothetical protein HOO96_41190 [Polyangiaceae bacterium]|nr:hypothetical protein [Polyangiaceae bacterium]